jgi:xanthine dehydrogenase accessory factor
VGDAEQVLKTASRWLAQGRQVCLATVVAREGSAPREVGAKMAVSDAGETAGSIGGGGLENTIIARARQTMEDGRPALVEYDLSGEAKGLDALCGGKVSVFIEPLGETKRLFVIGAGHVGRSLARVAQWVGFAVTAVDDRQEFLGRDALGKGVAAVCASPGEAASLGIDSRCFVVVCTRGHSLDKEWLRAIAPFRPRYVGMLGSREKARRVIDELRGEGLPSEFVDQVRSPVGVPIQAVTPEEIAISIAGDLILQWRTSRRGSK